MTSADRNENPEPAAPDTARRRKYLVIITEDSETRIAAYFAARRAKHSDGSVVLLHIVEPPDFAHWSSVSDAIRAEAYEKGQAILDEAEAEIADELTRPTEKVIREGRRIEETKKAIAEDPDIAVLVLGAAMGEKGSGPLVAALASRPDYLQARTVPVLVVPGNMTREEARVLA